MSVIGIWRSVWPGANVALPEAATKWVPSIAYEGWVSVLFVPASSSAQSTDTVSRIGL